MSKDLYVIIGIGGLVLVSLSRLIDRHNRKYIGNTLMRNRQMIFDKFSYILTVSGLTCAVTSFVGYLIN